MALSELGDPNIEVSPIALTLRSTGLRVAKNAFGNILQTRNTAKMIKDKKLSGAEEG